MASLTKSCQQRGGYWAQYYPKGHGHMKVPEPPIQGPGPSKLIWFRVPDHLGRTSIWGLPTFGVPS